MKMTKEDREELSALAEVNDKLNRPSFILRSYWHDGYARYVRRGLVLWGHPPDGFDPKRFAGITITPAGRRAIEAEGR